MTGVKSGTFAIPTSGHDFSGNTRYRITLTVTDSTGADLVSLGDRSGRRKVNLSFDYGRRPGLTLYLDGIAKVTPFVYDTLAGFTAYHRGPNQTAGHHRLRVRILVGRRVHVPSIIVPGGPVFTATYTAPPSTDADFRPGQGGVPQTPCRRSPSRTRRADGR